MSNKTAKGARQKYNSTIKEDVLKMAESGRSIPKIARSLGISEMIIYRWRNPSKNAQNSQKGTSVPNSQPRKSCS